MKNRPVIDPLAQRVRIEYAAEKDDGSLGGIPVFDRISMRDTLPQRVCFGCLGWRLGLGGHLWLRWSLGRGRCAARSGTFGGFGGRSGGVIVVRDLVVIKIRISAGLWLAWIRIGISLRLVEGLSQRCRCRQRRTTRPAGSRLAVDISRLIICIVDHIHKDGSFLRSRRMEPVVTNARGGHGARHRVTTLCTLLLVTETRTYIFVLAR